MSRSVEKKVKPIFKLWFEIDGRYIFGEGTFKLLEKIRDERSLRAAAEALDMSYRYAWGLVKNVEEHFGEPIVKAYRGGKHGGKTELTQAGLSLVSHYKKLKTVMTKACTF